jgi:hypothetical protein
MGATIMTGGGRHEEDSYVGLSVCQVREKFQSIWNIPDSATPQVNGRTVSDTYVLQDGDELLFAKPVGAKGN